MDVTGRSVFDNAHMREDRGWKYEGHGWRMKLRADNLHFELARRHQHAGECHDVRAKHADMASGCMGGMRCDSMRRGSVAAE